MRGSSSRWLSYSELEGDPRAEMRRSKRTRAGSESRPKGATDRGRRHDGKAIALAEKLVTHNPAAIAPRIALATNLHRASAIFPDEAERRAGRRGSQEILKSIPSASVELKETDTASLVGINHFNIGHEHWQKGRRAEALADFVAAQAVYDQLLEAGGASPQTRDYAGRNLLYQCRAYGAAAATLPSRRAAEPSQSFAPSHMKSPTISISIFSSPRRTRNSGFCSWRPSNGTRRSAVSKQARQTLKEMASRHGKLVSRMATIQERIAVVDINLMEAYAPDPVKYATAYRALVNEAYQICDKLSLVMHLSWNLRVAFAITSFALADYQSEDGLSPDLELIKKAERLWNDVHRESPGTPDAGAVLVVVRRRLAEELADRGLKDEATRWEQHVARHRSGQRRDVLPPGRRLRPKCGSSPARCRPD